MLCAADFATRGVQQIVMVKPDAPGADEALLKAVRAIYLPNRTLTVTAGTDGLPGPARGKGTVDGKPTAYVCQHQTCSLPVTTVAALQALLRPAAPSHVAGDAG